MIDGIGNCSPTLTCPQLLEKDCKCKAVITLYKHGLSNGRHFPLTPKQEAIYAVMQHIHENQQNNVIMYSLLIKQYLSIYNNSNHFIYKVPFLNNPKHSTKKGKCSTYVSKGYTVNNNHTTSYQCQNNISSLHEMQELYKLYTLLFIRICLLIKVCL